MVAYIVEKYAGIFSVVTHVDTFEKLQLRYDQNNEHDAALDHIGKEDDEALRRHPSADARRKIAEMEAAEAYFDSVGDDEEDEDSPNSLQRIADYGDDDDDDDDGSGHDRNGFGAHPSDDTLAHDKREGAEDDYEDREGFGGSQEQKPAFVPKRRRSNGFDEGTSAQGTPQHHQGHDDFETKDEDFGPLPPLRPRFESDEDLTADVFFRNRKSSQNQEEHKPVADHTTKAAMNGVGAGISFAMKKKARLQRSI